MGTNEKVIRELECILRIRTMLAFEEKPKDAGIEEDFVREALEHLCCPPGFAKVFSVTVEDFKLLLDCRKGGNG